MLTLTAQLKQTYDFLLVCLGEKRINLKCQSLFIAERDDHTSPLR